MGRLILWAFIAGVFNGVGMWIRDELEEDDASQSKPGGE
jgi:hypothetical protein